MDAATQDPDCDGGASDQDGDCLQCPQPSTPVVTEGNACGSMQWYTIETTDPPWQVCPEAGQSCLLTIGTKCFTPEPETTPSGGRLYRIPWGVFYGLEGGEPISSTLGDPPAEQGDDCLEEDSAEPPDCPAFGFLDLDAVVWLCGASSYR